MKKIFLSLLAVCGLFNIATNAQKLNKEILDKADAFVYSSGNYTISPEYQQTMRFIVETDSVILKISGAKMESRMVYPISRERFEQFKRDIAVCKIAKVNKQDKHLATGGSSHFFGIYDKEDNCIFGVEGYLSGGEMVGSFGFETSPQPLFMQIFDECQEADKVAKGIK